ncbi:MAG: hypothetical protein JWR69_322 [Pedosphaera sp.]|nr:hypothetical protein [Pedosphaera sp.]
MPVIDEASITQYITDTFGDIQIATAEGCTFYFHGPDRKFPFATLVTKDNDSDRTSNLDRPSVFRLNIGVSRATYHSLFGAPQGRAKAAGAADPVRDFTVLDQLMPHPVYGQMFWVCVLNPGAATFQAVQPLLAEAYHLAVARQAKRQG